MRKLLYLTLILAAGMIAACKKDKKNTGTTGASYSNLLKDSVYYYEKEDYLWNDAIPSYSSFNPRGYSGSSDLNASFSEVAAISQLKINPSTGKPYEYSPTDPGYPKYSFMDDGTTTASLGGTNGDFGFEPIYIAINDLRIKYVYPGSPADQAGLKRGYQITSINNNTNISYDGGSNVNFVVNAIYYSTSVTLGFIKLDGTTGTATVNVTNYTVNPVLTYKTFDLGSGKVVGYIAFNSFTDISNAKPQLNKAFNEFISKGVTNLVVDLRYNGGGDGQTSEYFADLIAPSSRTGTLMYTTYFNSNLQAGNAPLLIKKFGFSASDFKPSNNQVGFNKALTLQPSRVFFLVTSGTASSSELLINNLRPVVPIQLIGDTTYGKPVGEIPIPIGSDGKYILFSPQISVQNSASQGDYFAGMAPNSTSFPGKLVRDDVTKDFGDSTESLLANAIHFVKNGTYAITGPQVNSLSTGKQLFSLPILKSVAKKLDKHHFKPMVFVKKRK